MVISCNSCGHLKRFNNRKKTTNKQKQRAVINEESEKQNSQKPKIEIVEENASLPCSNNKEN